MEESKLEGPSTCLTFLGIEVDTVALQLRLPSDKLANLKDILCDSIQRRTMSKKDLQKLTGRATRQAIFKKAVCNSGDW